LEARRRGKPEEEVGSGDWRLESDGFGAVTLACWDHLSAAWGFAFAFWGSGGTVVVAWFARKATVLVRVLKKQNRFGSPFAWTDRAFPLLVL